MYVFIFMLFCYLFSCLHAFSCFSRGDVHFVSVDMLIEVDLGDVIQMEVHGGVVSTAVGSSSLEQKVILHLHIYFMPQAHGNTRNDKFELRFHSGVHHGFEKLSNELMCGNKDGVFKVELAT